MIYHFVNLVSWRGVSVLNLKNSIVFVDSVSLRVLLYLLTRHWYVKNSGVRFMNDEIPKKNIAVLLSAPDRRYTCSFVLPWMNEIYITRELKIFLDTLDKECVVIAISSPKQDKLATEIQKNYPKLDIYCLGAAVDAADKMYKKTPNWLSFLIVYPRRTWDKIFKTALEFLKIIFSREIRYQFIKFSKKLEQ